MKTRNKLLAIAFFFIISITYALPVGAQMIKHIAIGVFLDAPSAAERDRFYLRFHGPEVVYKSGPWMTRYVLFPVYDPPQEAAERFGAVAGRYAELWWRSIEEMNSRPSGGAFSLPHWEEDTGQFLPEGPTYSAHVPAVPTEIFYDPSPNPEKTSIIRWIQVIKYPEDVSVEEGEKWFLETHAKEALNQPGLLKFISYRCIDNTKLNVITSRWLDGEAPVSEEIEHTSSWVRMNEYWYKNFDAWQKAVIESPPEYTVPPWGGEYPFVKMGSTFIDYKWDIDFLKGNYIIP